MSCWSLHGLCRSELWREFPTAHNQIILDDKTKSVPKNDVTKNDVQKNQYIVTLCSVETYLYDTAGIKKMYWYIQTMHKTYQILLFVFYRNKLYFGITDIALTRDSYTFYLNHSIINLWGTRNYWIQNNCYMYSILSLLRYLL